MRGESPRRSVLPAGGFTLIELIVVLVVLGLLAALVGPQLFDRVSGAKWETARAQLELFGIALDNYRLDNGAYPTTEQGLATLNTRSTVPPAPSDWRGPYLRKRVPDDPWGRPYVYASPGTHDPRGYDLVSYGRDGEPGGTGEDADVASWE
ncbi:MAG: type II secretion system major pseudopilin GspG [Gemmatimonadota bacterium]